MSVKDYTNLSEITVKTQQELDEIPLDFKGRIYIEFGTVFSPAVVRNKYYYRVVARENSSVEAWENSSVVAWENSSVVARENSSVVARENSSVVAWENSSVVAMENSSVVAWGNSSVVARGNSSVVASANAQVVDRLNGGRIEITGNARIVHMPKTIHEFMDFYGVKHDKKTAVFYKAVHKEGERYFSDYQTGFTYRIGEKVKEACDPDVNQNCSFGIHVARLYWALDFGKNWKDLAILEVKTDIKDIVMPKGTDGKVRTCECTVLREVPLSECGVYGKILEKRNRRATDGKAD